MVQMVNIARPGTVSGAEETYIQAYHNVALIHLKP